MSSHNNKLSAAVVLSVVNKLIKLINFPCYFLTDLTALMIATVMLIMQLLYFCCTDGFIYILFPNSHWIILGFNHQKYFVI